MTFIRLQNYVALYEIEDQSQTLSAYYHPRITAKNQINTQKARYKR
jgi:hypothetical protein